MANISLSKMFRFFLLSITKMSEICGFWLVSYFASASLSMNTEASTEKKKKKNDIQLIIEQSSFHICQISWRPTHTCLKQYLSKSKLHFLGNIFSNV